MLGIVSICGVLSIVDDDGNLPKNYIYKAIEISAYIHHEALSGVNVLSEMPHTQHNII